MKKFIPDSIFLIDLISLNEAPEQKVVCPMLSIIITLMSESPSALFKLETKFSIISEVRLFPFGWKNSILPTLFSFLSFTVPSISYQK